MIMSNKSQSLLQQYLKASTLTPGLYKPSDAVKSANLVGVFSGNRPVLFTGASGDTGSEAQAQAFCESREFAAALQALNISESIQVRNSADCNFEWPEICEAVVASKAGESEDGAGEGDLMMINFSPYKELTVLLCVIGELASIIDAKAPKLDDGTLIEQFAQDNLQVLQLH